MDVQTGLVYVAVVVISAAVIVLVSMFGIKEKSYEEAIAEQRKLPDDLLLSMYNSIIICQTNNLVCQLLKKVFVVPY